MTGRARLLLALACGAVLAAFAISPASAAPLGSYAGVADGTGLTLTLGVGSSPIVDVGIGLSHGEVDSTTKAAGSGTGINIIDGTVATTDAPPDDSKTAEIFGIDIGDPSVGSLSAHVARGVSTSETTGDPSTANLGELLSAALTLTPGGVAVIGTPPFAVRSTSDVAVVGTLLTATAHADAVVIPIQLGDTIVDPLCDVVGGISAPLGQACEDAVGTVEDTGLTTVATVRILPATVECVYDGATEKASVPTAQAALLQVELFGQETVTVSAGQTIDLLEGTDLHIHAVVSDATSSVNGNEASAIASGLRLNLFEGDLPQVRLAASEVSCGVSGQLPPPAGDVVPRTGGGLTAIYLSAGGLLLLALGLRRFIKTAA
jgi:hypothetical protein